MSDLVRVYHPTTNEPFDVPKAKADHLRLEKGWNSQPLDPKGKPFVSDAEPRSEIEEQELADWRASEYGKEAVDYNEKIDAPSKPKKSK